MKLKSFAEIILIFSSTALILLLGIVFGYKQIQNSYQIPEEALELSTPIEGEIDVSFLEELKPAL